MFPAEPVGIGLALVLALAGVAAMHPEATIGPMMLAIAAVASVLSFLVSVVVRARTSSQRRVVSAHLIELRGLGDWPAHAALYASAALYAVTVEAMGLWSLPLAGLPYVFTHISLQRVQDTRVTYDQTIRALGAIPEAGHQVAAGHSRRTADLAVAIGAEVGLRATALRELEYAALLHDIGRVVLSNPAVSGTEYTFTDVSEWSAAIIGEVRLLEPVSAIVALQHAPYRQEGQVRDPMVPRASQIVRIAAKYDSSLSDGLAPTVALEALHRGAAYDYDPDIVMSLRRVLERRGSLAA
jgi:HD-GYP domain-containing protein (c-di-GMP phosphodiesterase class II)